MGKFGLGSAAHQPGSGLRGCAESSGLSER